MLFTETSLSGAFVVDLERHEDERGFFAREFCEKEFAAHGLKPVTAQSSLCFNTKAGTLRGMHFQYPPATEAKLVRCLRGAAIDIVVDLRPESPTYLKHVAVELDEDNWRALYLPERFAHGYQTLSDNTVMSYHMSAFYTLEAEGGLRHDDPALGLEWPMSVAAISDKDRSFKTYESIQQTLKWRMSNRECREAV